MEHKLFRQRAIEHQRDRLFGAVKLTQPVSLTLISSSIVAVVIIVSLILVFGKYPRKQVAHGYLVPVIAMAKVYATKPGVLSELNISEGDHVTKNQLLFNVTTKSDERSGVDTDTALLKTNEDQRALLQKQYDYEDSLYQSRIANVEEKHKGLERELTQNKKSIEVLQRGVGSSRELVARVESYNNAGHVSHLEYEAVKQQLLSIEIELQEYITHSIKLKNNIDDLVNSANELHLERISRLAKIEHDLSVIDQQNIQLSSRREYAIRAPINGVITALQGSLGQSVDARDLLVTVLPEGNSLKAELFLPTRAIGFIERDQVVYVRFHSFPYQRYGVHKGHITSVTKVILAPDEVPAPLALDEPVYRATVRLDNQEIIAHGKELPLQAGMLFSADVILDERNLIEWILEPVLSLRGNR